MLKTQVVSFDIPAQKLDSFHSLFFSKEEHLTAAREAAEDLGGWKKKLKERQSFNRATLIKDPMLQQRVIDLLQLKGIEDSSVGGYYEQPDPSSIVVNVTVKAKAPSLIFRLLFDETIGALIQVRAERRGDRVAVTVSYAGRQVLGVLGCLVIIITFGACILPGFVALYFASHINSTWSAMTEAVGQALQEALARE